jgi:hypothetical protein
MLHQTAPPIPVPIVVQDDNRSPFLLSLFTSLFLGYRKRLETKHSPLHLSFHIIWISFFRRYKFLTCMAVIAHPHATISFGLVLKDRDWSL